MTLLYDILRDGTLRDNRTYRVSECELTDARLGATIQLQQKTSGRKSRPQLWTFLTQSARQVSDLLKERTDESVVLFNDKDYQHNTPDSLIQIYGDVSNFSLATGNLVGCVKRGDYSLKISSRFGDTFLKYIVADADGFLELKDYGGDRKGEYEWLLAYLWLIKLKRAFRLGLPKTYVSKTETTARVRGRIHPVEYFLYGERAAYKCTYREHSYCNPATILLAETFRKLRTHLFVREARTIENSFSVAAEGRKTSLQQLLATPHFSNPFYSDYNGLIDLSKMLLRNESADFGEDSQTSAFFFDVSMLFEYFVRKLIKRNGVQVQAKDDRQWNIPSGRRHNRLRKLEPDLLFLIDGKLCVFDVKYKSYDFEDGVSREDLFQLHTYVGQCSNLYEVATCGLIYPVSERRWNTEGLARMSGKITDIFRQGKREVPFHVFFIRVPPSEDEGFTVSFKESCNAFLKNLRKSVIQ